MGFDYEDHPYVRERRDAAPDLPFAVIDQLALDNWANSNLDATADEVRAAILAPEYVLWSSHPIDGDTEVVAITEVGPQPPWPPIRVVDLRR